MRTIVRGYIVVNSHAARMAKIAAINQCFAQVLRDLRRSKGLSQERLALEAGLDRSFVSLLERGRRQPTLKTLFAIADVLHVPPHEIVRAVERADAVQHSDSEK